MNYAKWFVFRGRKRFYYAVWSLLNCTWFYAHINYSPWFDMGSGNKNDQTIMSKPSENFFFAILVRKEKKIHSAFFKKLEDSSILRASQDTLPSVVVYPTLYDRRAAAFLHDLHAVSTASTVAVSTAETSAPALLPSEAAPAAWAGPLRLAVEPLHLLRQGGRRAPAGHGVLSRRRLLHGPHVGALT